VPATMETSISIAMPAGTPMRDEQPLRRRRERSEAFFGGRLEAWGTQGTPVELGRGEELFLQNCRLIRTRLLAALCRARRFIGTGTTRKKNDWL